MGAGGVRRGFEKRRLKAQPGKVRQFERAVEILVAVQQFAIGGVSERQDEQVGHPQEHPGRVEPARVALGLGPNTFGQVEPLRGQADVLELFPFRGAAKPYDQFEPDRRRQRYLAFVQRLREDAQ